MDYYDYSYTYNMSDESIVAGILAIYLIILAVLFIFYVVNYVFKGIGMYTIAKRQGKDYPWLAFIPFARTYLHGELAGNIRLKNKMIKNPGIWYLALPFIFGAVNFVFYILMWVIGFGAFADIYSDLMYGYYYSSPSISGGMITGLIILLIICVVLAIIYEAIYGVLEVLINHQIYERFTSNNMSIVHAILGTVIPLYESFCLFAMRNTEFNPGMGPDLGTPFMQSPPPAVPPQGGPVPVAQQPGPDGPGMYTAAPGQGVDTKMYGTEGQPGGPGTYSAAPNAVQPGVYVTPPAPGNSGVSPEAGPYAAGQPDEPGVDTAGPNAVQPGVYVTPPAPETSGVSKETENSAANSEVPAEAQSTEEK